MAVRRTLRRIAAVAALSTVGLGIGPFTGTALALEAPQVSPENGKTAGPTPVISAKYQAALNTTASLITLSTEDTPSVEGDRSFSADGKTIIFTPDAPLGSDENPYTVTVLAFPAAPGDAPPNEARWTFSVDDSAPALTVAPTVTPDPANGPVDVSGTTDPNTLVALSIVKEGTTTPAVTRPQITSTGTGAYSFTGVDLGTLGQGTLRATVTATDAYGNAATISRTFVRDSVAPARATTTPADGKTSQTRNTVEVTFTEPLRPASSTLVVKNGFNGTIAGSVAWSNGDRTATFTSVSNLLPSGGNFSVAAHAVDLAGNISDTTSTFSIDNTAPLAPSVTLTDPVNAANVGSAVVAGKAEPGATIAVEVDDATAGSPVTASAPADPTTGDYSVQVALGALADGTIQASAWASDYAGNKSAPGTSALSTKDVVRPATPAAGITSPIAGNRVAVVSGTAAADVVSVSISVDDTDATTAPVTAAATPDSGGAYTATLTLTGLKDGAVTATVYASDAVGNRSANAGTATGTLDTGLPQLTSLAMPTVNDANKTAATASGKAEPGTLVTVTVSDGAVTQTSSVTAAATTGSYSTAFDTTAPALADGPLTVTAVAKDAAGNESAPIEIEVTKDTGVPAAPSLVVPQWANAAGHTAVELSGTAEASSTLDITLTDKDGKSVPFSHVTPPNGSWTKVVTFAGLADGAVTVSVTQRDAAGNTSAATAETVQKDTAAPAKPVVTLTNPIDTTNVASTVVSGTAEAGSEIAFSIDDTDAATQPVTGPATATGGSYTATVSVETLKDGELTASATATDAAANTSAAGQTATPSAKDTTELANTATVPADGSVVLPPATISATFNESLSTTQTAIALRDQSGSVLAGTTSFTGGNTVVFTPVDTLSDAGSPYVVTYSARDADGTDTAPGEFSFIVDTVAPPMPTLSLPAVNGVNADAVVVSGEAEQGTTVTVSVDDATAGSPVTQTVPTTGGTYTATLDLSGLADGQLTATAVARDVAGNPSPTRTVAGQKDATPPAKPTIVLPAYVNHSSQGAVPISGVTDEAASIVLTIDDSVPGSPVTKSVATNAAGTYATSVDASGLLDGPLTIDAVATDAFGNVSETRTTAAQKDVGIPAVPTAELSDPVNKANATEAVVSGVAEAGSTVLISIDDATAGDPVTATAEADGTSGAYTKTVDVSSLADTTITATVTARDAAGNVSAETTDTAVKDATEPLAPTVASFGTANVANQTVTVAGNAERGTTVSVSIDDTDALTAPVTGTATEQPEGTTPSWSAGLDVSSLTDGTLTATVVATDSAGNSSAATTAEGLKDTVPPAVPTVTLPDPINASMPQLLVSGTADPGTSAWVTMSDTRPDSGEARKALADDAGKYSVSYDVTARPDGLLTVTAYAEDVAGNTSATSAPVTATKDAKAPEAPTVELADPVNAANATSVSVSGVAEPGSAVAVSVDDATAGDPVTAATTADGTTGAYSVSVDITSLADGTITATVTATDAVGNRSSAGTDTSTKDSTLPEVPTLTAPAPVTRTSRAAAPFSGTAEPAATVSVTVDDDADATTAAVTGTTLAAPDGTWSLSLDVSSLRDGVLSVAVTATDAVSNTSGSATGSVAKNVTRLFTVDVDDTTPVSGRAQRVTVTAHATYLPGSATDTTYTGTPVLTSADGHTTAGTCSAAVAGVATCTGTVFGDLGTQTLQGADGTGEDALQGAQTVAVQPVSLVYGTPPPATTEPNTPFTFTVLPTAGVTGASIDGYAAKRTLVTNSASSPANGTVLTCAAAVCSVTVKFLDRGSKTVAVFDNSSPVRSTPIAPVFIKHHSVLTLSRSALTVDAGSTVTLSGKLIDTTTTDGVAGGSIAIYRATAPSTTFTPYVTTLTRSDGTWSKAIPISRNTTYEVRYAGSDVLTPAVSPRRLVKAAQVVSSTWSASGRTVTVSGRVRPTAAGRTVYLQYRKADGSWAYAGAKATVTSTGRYAMSRTLSAGPWRLRAAVAATSVNAAGYSATYLTRLR